MNSLARLHAYFCEPHHSLKYDQSKLRHIYYKNTLVLIAGIIYFLMTLIDKIFNLQLQNPSIMPIACLTVAMSILLMKKYPMVYDCLMTLFLIIVYPAYEIFKV